MTYPDIASAPARLSGMLGAAALAAALTGAAPPAQQVRPADVAAACKLEDGRVGKVPGITVQEMPAAAGDLPYILIRIAQRDAVARIYHDPDLRQVARAGAACFGGALALLQPHVPDTREHFEWASMVLTRDPDYKAPGGAGPKRWIQRGFSGRWDMAGLTYLTVTMPHEHVHESQDAQRSKTAPRWFQEGHAMWTGLIVSDLIRPDLAAVERATQADNLALLKEPHLASWGGVMIKPEAIDRQLSPEDRERRAKDPTYIPNITFNFRPGDYAEDIENQVQRYGAALALFERLERRHGRDAVLAWIAAVLKDPDNARIVALAREMLGEDIAPLLQ